MTLKTTASAIALLASSSFAFADGIAAPELEAVIVPPPPGQEWYVSVFAGYADFDDYEFIYTVPRQLSTFPYRLELGNGYLAGVALGVGDLLGPNIRSEIELSHMSTDDYGWYGATNLGFIGINPVGSIASTNLLLNTWLDIPLSNTSIVPYVGFGVGVGYVRGDLTISNGFGQQFTGSDTGFAYQVGLGASIPLSNGTIIDVSYRYRGVQNVQFDPGPTFVSQSISMSDGDITAHTLQVGARFEF